MQLFIVSSTVECRAILAALISEARASQQPFVFVAQVSTSAHLPMIPCNSPFVSCAAPTTFPLLLIWFRQVWFALGTSTVLKSHWLG